MSEDAPILTENHTIDWRDGLLARVKGEPVTELPTDLYIPPDALQVFLEAFEGPLDFLLYLIKKQNIDILDIPMAKITNQYMQYIDLMENMTLELAGEYLVMAATLAEIKSRMMLPKVSVDGEEPVDPRADLVRRLQEYERFKKAAEDLEKLDRLERDIFVAEVDKPKCDLSIPQPDVSFTSLMDALKDVMARAKLYSHHQIQLEAFSVRERVLALMDTLTHDSFTRFESLFNAKEGRMGVVVTMIAILELVRDNFIVLSQSEPFAPLYVKAKFERENNE
jgi:segregation and condensation protein A